MYGNLETFLGAANPAAVNRETALLKHMFSMDDRWQLHHRVAAGQSARALCFL
jgi:hypothetical protein